MFNIYVIVMYMSLFIFFFINRFGFVCLLRGDLMYIVLEVLCFMFVVFLMFVFSVFFINEIDVYVFG